MPAHLHAPASRKVAAVEYALQNTTVIMLSHIYKCYFASHSKSQKSCNASASANLPWLIFYRLCKSTVSANISNPPSSTMLASNNTLILLIPLELLPTDSLQSTTQKPSTQTQPEYSSYKIQQYEKLCLMNNKHTCHTEV